MTTTKLRGDYTHKTHIYANDTANMCENTAQSAKQWRQPLPSDEPAKIGSATSNDHQLL
jgi:hypothetical protein